MMEEKWIGSGLMEPLGYFVRFIVLKRLVVAEIELIEDDAVESEALATGVCFCLCPMTK